MLREEGREKEIEETQREFHHEEEEEHADINTWKYILGFSEMAVVKCAIDLGIADAIESQGSPITLSDLSSTLGCAPSPLYGIIRFLMHRRIFKEKLTTQGSPGKGGDPPTFLSARVLANGTSSFEKAHGEDLWSYTAANPDHSQLFNEAMACDARLVVPAMIQGCPGLFDGNSSLVDVGGDNGTTIKLLVKACPWLQGINFDLPHVVTVAAEISGVEHVGGDMFESVLKADAAFIMVKLHWVLHDWADKECIQILKKCKEAILEDKGKVIIIDAVIQEQEEMDKLTDTWTLKEWGFVLGETGFSRYTVKPPTRALQSVIEACP
ncbi:hypothetical protein ACB098_07G155900 [Castanea mollissima]